MIEKYCRECGAALIEKELKNEGVFPFCPECGEFRFPLYNVAVSMIIVNRHTNQILLIQQYGKPFYVLVAGYVNRTEALENAVAREIKEETGMTVSEIRFNRTRFFERSNTLMCNFTAFVENDAELQPNEEIDSFAWFSSDDARKNIRQNSLAAYFLNTFLDEWNCPTEVGQ